MFSHNAVLLSFFLFVREDAKYAENIYISSKIQQNLKNKLVLLVMKNRDDPAGTGGVKLEAGEGIHG